MKNLLKIKFAIIMVLFVFSQTNHAQWSTNGSSIVYTYDRVGIGTNTPDRLLEVYSSNNPTLRLTVDDDREYKWDIETNVNDLDLSFKYGETPTTKVIFTGSGRVGIGTTSPSQKLHVIGNIRVDSRHIYLGAYQDLYGDNSSALYWDANHSSTTQMIFRDKENTVYGRVYGSGNGAYFGLLDGDGNWSYIAAKDSYTAFRINNSEKMRIKSNGDVGIGTTSPDYKLDVDGTIRCEELIVEDVGADYVFEKDYKLPSLLEVERFIKENGHLPDVSPVSETVQSVKISEFNSLLLQKIEELTLYVIDLKKENHELLERIEILEQ